MTEGEFSHLLAQLADTAKILNEKSDSVNTLIGRFQDTLRSMNVGLEVWPVSLDSEAWMETNERDGEEYERGKVDKEFGFVKYDGKWMLATRLAYYDHGSHGFANVWDFVRADTVTPLLEESRDTRLDALEEFPQIAKSLKEAAEKAIRTIEEAKKVVMGSPQATAPPTELEQLAKKLVGRGDAPEPLPPGVASGNKMLMDTAAQVVRQRRSG